MAFSVQIDINRDIGGITKLPELHSGLGKMIFTFTYQYVLLLFI